MSDYHRLPIAQKKAQAISRMREPAVSCPGGCGVQVMRADLLVHIEQRCTGRIDPGPGAKWFTHREALAMGLARVTLSRWTQSGRVRTRVGDDGCRQYLHGDLVDCLASRRLKARR